MEGFIEFLREYWQFIAPLLLLAVEIIFVLVKRRPKSHDEFVDAINECLIMVPTMVQWAELHFDTGLEKKDQVMATLLTYVEKKLGHALNTKQVDYFISQVSKQVESVLECPVKEGGFGREEIE